ncbi:MAG: hypothetical protein ABI520_00435 [Caldimonas sp.]
MNAIRLCTLTAALALAATLAPAQPGPSTAAPAASASERGPGMGPGMGMGPGRMGPGARGPRGRAGTDFTPGWSLMTPVERREHQARMQSMTGAAECNAYTTQHRQQMGERAKERGMTMPAHPRRDACAGLKP